MNLPLVSVIVPNYNHEVFLKHRLETIFTQTYPNIEVILLDDASSDGSTSILEAYKNHPKVSHFEINSTNSGSLFKQWIKGIEKVRGDYVWIAESDDYSHLDFIKNTIEGFQSYPTAGLVFTDSNIVDDSGKVIETASESNTMLTKLKNSKKFLIDNRSDIPLYFITHLLIWNASSVVFSKSALEKVDFEVLQNLKNAGDLFAYISIALDDDVLYVDKPLNYFRTHDQNVTKKNIASGVIYKDRISIIHYFLKRIKALEGSDMHLNNFFNRHFFPALDFQYFKDVQNLSKSYFKLKLLSFSTYIKLNMYSRMVQITGNKLPHRYRMYIKKILARTVQNN